MERYNAVLQSVCREWDVAWIDLRSLQGREELFYDDCHFNEAGAREVAAIVAGPCQVASAKSARPRHREAKRPCRPRESRPAMNILLLVPAASAAGPVRGHPNPARPDRGLAQRHQVSVVALAKSRTVRI